MVRMGKLSSLGLVGLTHAHVCRVVCVYHIIIFLHANYWHIVFCFFFGILDVDLQNPIARCVARHVTRADRVARGSAAMLGCAVRPYVRSYVLTQGHPDLTVKLYTWRKFEGVKSLKQNCFQCQCVEQNETLKQN